MSKEVIITDRDVPVEVLNAVAEGRKVVAIKLLRDETGLGLANAKVIVDRLATEHGPRQPAHATIREEGNGKGLVILLVLAGLAFLAWRYLAGA